MLVACLSGGLGNQLFQYSAAYCFARLRGDELYIDACSKYLKDNYSRRVELIDKGLPGKMLTKSLPGAAMLLTLIRSAARHGIITRICDANMQSGWGRLAAARRGPIVLDGYFQDYTLFDQYRADLQMLLRDVSTQERTLAKLPWAKEQGMSTVCAIHTRGRIALDASGRISNNHRPASAAYYKNAMDRLLSDVQISRFLLFSDGSDTSKIRQYAEMKQIPVTESEEEDPWCALQLMSCCGHHIVSASTFSWWGRWLSRSEGLCMSPFADRHGQVYRIPPDWICVEG